MYASRFLESFTDKFFLIKVSVFNKDLNEYEMIGSADRGYKLYVIDIIASDYANYDVIAYDAKNSNLYIKGVKEVSHDACI